MLSQKVLSAMGLKYVVDVDMLEAHDQACEDRKKEDENGVPPFDHARMKTMTYSAAAFLHMDPAATDTTPKGLEAVVTKMRATATGKVALLKWDEMVITVIKNHDDNRANNGNGGKGGKGNDGKGGKGNDGKGGKGATDQTYYDKNGVVIWRSKADQAAHMAQKQQQRKP